MTVKHFLPKLLLFIVLALALFFLFRGQTAQAPHLPAAGPVPEAQAFILPLAETTYLPLRDFNIADPVTDAKAAGVFDVHSGKLLFGKNVDERLPIASIAKLLTAVAVMENLPLNGEYTVAAEDINVDGTGADLVKGERLRGGDLLKIMLIKSSNDAALTFARNAERLGINLVAKLNEKAALLGMTDSHFVDPAGLDDNGYSTINDVIKLTRYTGKYPIIGEILITESADLTALDGQRHHLINTNRLLEQMPGIVSGKTGYTDGAGETMVLEVLVNGGRDRVISVVLGTGDRFSQSRQLMEWALRAYRWR